MQEYIKNIQIYADGASLQSMIELSKKDYIAGLTTNPTLMFKSGITNYKAFAQEVLANIKDKSISFEVFSDDFVDMKRQALEITSWGSNIFVKIPITNTKGESSVPLIGELSHSGVKVNATALFTVKQVSQVAQALKGGAPSICSVFAGRIFDAAVDAVPIMKESLKICQETDAHISLLWASPRQLYDIVLASSIGCHIITISPDILSKLGTMGKDLDQFSLETCQMFYNDALKAKFTL